MAYSTKNDLCNAALNYLGEPDATPFTGGTTVRDIACARHYDNALQTVLTHHRWDCATSVAALTLTATQPTHAPADFPYSYDIPSTCLRFQEVILSNGLKLLDFKIIGKKLFLNANSYVGKIIFTLNDLAVTDMPPTFADCVMLELCKRIAPAITQNPQIMEQMAAHHREAFSKALTTETRNTRSNENASPLSIAHQSSVFLSRFQR